jgi:hypothetical protein
VHGAPSGIVMPTFPSASCCKKLFQLCHALNVAFARRHDDSCDEMWCCCVQAVVPTRQCRLQGRVNGATHPHAVLVLSAPAPQMTRAHVHVHSLSRLAQDKQATHDWEHGAAIHTSVVRSSRCYAIMHHARTRLSAVHAFSADVTVDISPYIAGPSKPHFAWPEMPKAVKQAVNQGNLGGFRGT